MKTAATISCSLSTDSLFNLSYSYTPQEGVRVSCFFANALGNYTKPILDGTTKSVIKIGPLTLQMLPVYYEMQLQYGRRVLKVDFVDDTRLLNNHHVCLVGRGCGANVHPLGKVLNPAQITSKSLDDTVKNLTQFQDLEYSFNDLLAEITKVIPVQNQSTFDATITRNDTGTFKSVLNEWCHFYGLTWYVENGSLHIINVAITPLIIDSSIVPVDATEYEESSSIEETYGKTVAFYFNQEGNDYETNTSALNSATLYPIGTDTSVPQIVPDSAQVAAALCGRSFWFLYNYYRGTAGTQCGWTPLSISTSNPGSTLLTSLTALNKSAQTVATAGAANLPPPPFVDVAVIDEAFFDQQFEAYSQYGQNIAGKYYLSNPRGTILNDQACQWFNVTNNSITDYASEFADSLKVQVEFLLSQGNTSRDVVPPDFSDVFPPGSDPAFTSVVKGTQINQSFPGVNFTDDRLLFVDTLFPDASKQFKQSDALCAMADAFFAQLFTGMEGSESLDYSEVANGAALFKRFASYYATSLPAPLTDLFDKTLPGQFYLLAPRFNQINLSGTSTANLASQQNANTTNALEVLTSTQGSTLSSAATLQAIPLNGSRAYYAKYSQCSSASSPVGIVAPFRHEFEPKEISSDIPLPPSYSKTSQSSYLLKRDISYLNALTTSTLLNSLAVGRTFPTNRVTFSLNYFYPLIAVNPISKGLVNLNVSIGDNGITTTYTFSNEILQTPYTDAFIQRLTQQVRNSWIRQYNPPFAI